MAHRLHGSFFHTPFRHPVRRCSFGEYFFVHIKIVTANGRRVLVFQQLEVRRFARKFQEFEKTVNFIVSVRIPSDPANGWRMAYRYEVLHSSGTSRRNLEVHCQKDRRRWESNLHRALDRSNVGCVLWTVAYLSHIERPQNNNNINLADDVFFLWKSIRVYKFLDSQLHLTEALPTVTREGAR